MSQDYRVREIKNLDEGDIFHREMGCRYVDENGIMVETLRFDIDDADRDTVDYRILNGPDAGKRRTLTVAAFAQLMIVEVQE